MVSAAAQYSARLAVLFDVRECADVMRIQLNII